MEKENEEARRAARRLEKERKRLEMGSDYEPSQDEDEEGNNGAGYRQEEYFDSDESVSSITLFLNPLLLKELLFFLNNLLLFVSSTTLSQNLSNN